MQKFVGVLRRWEGGDLSMTEAGELLGMSERQFRRYRDRYEEAGEAGLLDGAWARFRHAGFPRRRSRRCWSFIVTATLAGT
ncbi:MULTISPECIES: helix-turn-helix domain-containing protein [Mesorhizobium]|uniref:helix-turn-helix domain-containing protein n=1 Tax=Mesorhizobium japonicum TaxID=2066070 RepID=UPI0018CE72F5